VAKANGLDLEIVETNTEKPTDEYLKYNALSKVPTFVGADGYVLSECIAIAVYSTCSKPAQRVPLCCPAPRTRRA
jgi:elongation factor 1-gamma